MTANRFEKGFTWGGLALASVAALAFALVSAAGVGAEEAAERQTKIKLMVDREGAMERLELVDLHEMEVGESRSLSTESGRPVTVTRDEAGFEVDVDGKKIRVQDHFDGEIPPGAPGEATRFEKRIVIGGDGEGEPQTMVFHSQDGEPGNVVVMKRTGGPEGDGFAWSSNGAELPAIPFGVEGTIARLEKSAKFQELDPATRATVLEALRESTPERLRVSGEPGRKMVLIEVEEDESE